MRLFFYLLLAAPFLVVAPAEDLRLVTNIGSKSESALFGVSANPSGQFLSCSARENMPTGLLVDHNDGRVRGLRLICRPAGQSGAVETTLAFESITARIGSAGPTVTRLECTSGRAISGIRFRTAPFLNAISISCGSLILDLTDILTFTNDPAFGDGSGARVNRGATENTEFAGSTTGTSGSFSCPAARPFVVRLGLLVGLFGEIDATKVVCTEVGTAPLTTTLQRPQLVIRTIGQQRKLHVTKDADQFTVEMVNRGATVAGANLYFDVIFSALDLDVTSLPAECSFLSSGTIRCPVASLARGESIRKAFTINPKRTRPEAPILVVQASTQLDDIDLSNNTYGFATIVVP